MRLRALNRILVLLSIAALLSGGTAFAMDEAVLTPTSKAAVAQDDKEFNDAMGIWFKHRYADSEKLASEFADTYIKIKATLRLANNVERRAVRHFNSRPVKFS